MTITKSDKSSKRYMGLRIAPSLKRFVIHRLDEMEEFKNFTLSSIKSEKKSISARFDKDTKYLSEEQKEEYINWNSEDYFMIDDVFTQISMRSFIVILFSYIEDGMNTLCNAVYSDKARYHKKEGLEEFKVKYNDMQGKGINRAKLYMEKIMGCNLHSDMKPWSEIETLRKIRNTIVHDDGNAGNSLKNDTNFKQHLNDGRLKLENHNKIKIEPSYLDDILLNVSDYFSAIDLK
jgi:hypothetical protein